ncbi:MAG TPA: hypothetical protein DCY36_11240, partial [Acidimicrobiaceae bacterium]|nr:hypothetical protein [Acidimicrobiaceae bacterium]
MKETLVLGVTQEVFQAAPGRAKFSIVVKNHGSETESIFLRIIGAPEGHIDARPLEVGPGDEETLSIVLTIPPGFPDGKHEVQFDLIEVGTARQRTSQIEIIEIPDTSAVTLRVLPSSMWKRRGGRIRVQVRNRSEDDLKLSLESFPESEDLRVRLDATELNIAGYSRATVHGKIRSSLRFLGRERNLGFSVVGWSNGDPIYGRGVLRQRAVFSNGPQSLMIALFLIVAFLGLGVLGLRLMSDSEQVLPRPLEIADAEAIPVSDSSSLRQFTLSGTVVLSDGSSASGTKVTWTKFVGLEETVDPNQPVTRRKSVTLSDDSFVLPGLSLDSPYEIYVSRDGYVPVSRIIAGDGELFALGEITLNPADGQLEVQIFDAASPAVNLGGVDLRLTGVDGSLLARTSELPGSLGSYTFSSLSVPGTYILEAFKSDYGTLSQIVELKPNQKPNLVCGDDGANSPSAQGVAAQNSQQISFEPAFGEAEPVLRCGLSKTNTTISGYVELLSTTQPVTTAEFQAVSYSPVSAINGTTPVKVTLAGRSLTRQTQTVAAGNFGGLLRYQFPDIPIPSESNPYTITFEATNFQTRTFVITGAGADLGQGSNLQPSSCSETTWSCLRIRSSTGSISGRLKVTNAASGSAAQCPSHLQISVLGNGEQITANIPPQTVTDPTGTTSCSFRLDSFTPGDYVVTLSGAGIPTNVFSCAVIAGGVCELGGNNPDQVVAIPLDDSSKLGVLRLKTGFRDGLDASLESGQSISALSLGLIGVGANHCANVTVVKGSIFNRSKCQFYSDSAGDLIISNIAAMGYVVVPVSTEFMALDPTMNVPAGTDEYAPKRLAITPKGTLQLLVNNDNGTPVPNASVTLKDLVTNTTLSCPGGKTNANGQCNFVRALQNHPYQVTISVAGLSRVVDIAGTLDSTIFVQQVLQFPAVISGYVQAAEVGSSRFQPLGPDDFTFVSTTSPLVEQMKVFSLCLPAGNLNANWQPDFRPVEQCAGSSGSLTEHTLDSLAAVTPRAIQVTVKRVVPSNPSSVEVLANGARVDLIQRGKIVATAYSDASGVATFSSGYELGPSWLLVRKAGYWSVAQVVNVDVVSGGVTQHLVSFDDASGGNCGTTVICAKALRDLNQDGPRRLRVVESDLNAFSAASVVQMDRKVTSCSSAASGGATSCDFDPQKLTVAAVKDEA